ncbi:hypothetical protein ZOSMA_183G00350 [Zostera marina]|uniref:Uncharacterized protein n=1 Tax=Zostera marina TaxID=29655 RepID=A0A0K9PQQ5_ZOSMR|nr:hypothetical protein ZOSMA_183G00350 [Zostera marina]
MEPKEDTSSHFTSSIKINPCRKKKSQNASFIQDIKDHIDEFINASMEDHKNCFKSTMQRMFNMSKAVEDKSEVTKPQVESSLPLKKAVSE